MEDKIEVFEGTTPQENLKVAVEDNTEVGDGKEQDEKGVSVDGAPFLTVRYNHRDKELCEDEAKTLAQKGLAYDSIYPKLKRAAALKGMDVKAFVSSFERNEEDAYRASLVEQYGEESEAVEGLMELYRAKKDALVQDAVDRWDGDEAKRKASVEEQFKALKSEFPDIKSYESLPPEVLSDVEGGAELLPSYLKYKYFEDKRIKESERKAAESAAASAGALGSNEVTESTMDAFLKGLRG